MAGELCQVNGHKLYVEQHGAADGSAVVLLHDGLGSVVAWKAQTPVLVDSGYRVVAYDRWGYGQSEPRLSFPAPHFEEDIADLGALIAQLDLGRPALLGHSDGGTIALYFAAFNPQAVRGLIVVAAHIYVEDSMNLGIEVTKNAYQNDERLRHSLQRQHSGKADAVFSNWYDGWVKPASLNWDLRPLLGKISCPALIVQGMDDEYATPQHARDIAAGIPGAQLWLEEGAQHMLPQEMPARFNQRMLEFLGKAAKQERRYVQ